MSKRSKQFLSLYAGASAHLQPSENTGLMRSSIKTWEKIRSVDSHLIIDLCWRPGSEEYDSYGSICSFCLFTVHGFTRDSHSVLSSLRGAELSRLQVPWVYKKMYRPLKRKSKYRNTAAQRYIVIFGSPCLFFTP